MFILHTSITTARPAFSFNKVTSNHHSSLLPLQRNFHSPTQEYHSFFLVTTMLSVDSVVNQKKKKKRKRAEKPNVDVFKPCLSHRHNKFFFFSDCFASKLRSSRTNRRALSSKSLFLVKLGIYRYILVVLYLFLNWGSFQSYGRSTCCRGIYYFAWNS